MRFVWSVEGNVFSNLRFVPDGYVLKANEREGQGDALPLLESLPGFVQPLPPLPVVISRRQFYQASAMRNMINQQEALDAMRHGTIPAKMQEGIDTMPPDQKFAAEMMLTGAGEFDRNHPLVEKFGEIMGMPDQVLDDLWRFAAEL